MSLSALDLHNALFNQQPSADIYTTPPRHTRHRSSASQQSQSTLQPQRGPPPSTPRLHASKQTHTPAQSLSAPHRNPYSYADPYSPLEDGLEHPDPAYAALLSRQPHHPAGPGPGWDMGLSLGGDPPTMAERKEVWQKEVRRRLRRLRTTKSVLEVLLGVSSPLSAAICLWALFATVRYLYVFTLYRTSSTGEALSAALGILSALALALLLSAFILAAFAGTLVPMVLAPTLHKTRTGLRAIASLCILAPAVASLCAVANCTWDTDPVWAAPRIAPSAHPCGDHSAWLVVCVARLLATLAILGAYHHTARAYARTRRPVGISSEGYFNSHGEGRGAYVPSYTVDPDMRFHTLLRPVASASTDTHSHTSVANIGFGGKEVKMTLIQSRPTSSAGSSTTLFDPVTGGAGGKHAKSLKSMRSRSNSNVAATAPPPLAEKGSHTDLDATPRAPRTRTRSTSRTPSPPPVVPGPSRRASTASTMSKLSAYSYPRAWAEYAEGGPSPVGSAEDGAVAVADSPYASGGAGWDDFGAPAVLPLPLPQPTSHYTPSYEVDAPLYDYDSGYGGAYDEPDQVRVLGGYIARMPTIASFGSHERGSLASRTPSASASHSASRPASQSGYLGVGGAGNGGSASSRSALSSGDSPEEDGRRPSELEAASSGRERREGSSTAGTGSWGRSVVSQSASGTLYEDESER
ncbi:hypothetical protein HWV62_2382 [Athelia sp. TMB]|nr:hypothetical protein HWV62_2382 [Athelia sp. TMB]